MTCDKTQICKNYPRCQQDSWPYPKCCHGFSLKMKAYFEDSLSEEESDKFSNLCFMHALDEISENEHVAISIVGSKNVGMTLAGVKFCPKCYKEIAERLKW